MLWSQDKAWGDKLKLDADLKGKGVYREGTLVVELARFPEKFRLTVRRTPRSTRIVHPDDLQRFVSALQVPGTVKWKAQSEAMKHWECEWRV